MPYFDRLKLTGGETVQAETISMRLYFGKHIGEELCNVDLGYVCWPEEQSWTSPELREACQYEIQRRMGNITSLGRAVGTASSKPKKVSLVNPK